MGVMSSFLAHVVNMEKCLLALETADGNSVELERGGGSPLVMATLVANRRRK